jgi:hypothetical protein
MENGGDLESPLSVVTAVHGFWKGNARISKRECTDWKGRARISNAVCITDFGDCGSGTGHRCGVEVAVEEDRLTDGLLPAYHGPRNFLRFRTDKDVTEFCYRRHVLPLPARGWHNGTRGCLTWTPGTPGVHSEYWVMGVVLRITFQRGHDKRMSTSWPCRRLWGPGSPRPRHKRKLGPRECVPNLDPRTPRPSG